MGSISVNTLRRLYLLYLIGRYQKGVYGSKRLQKLTFLSEYDRDKRPFSFIKYTHGQYSEELADMVAQLATLGYVAVTSLDTVHVDELGIESSGSRYVLTSRANLGLYRQVLAATDPSIPERINATITKWGWESTDKLIEYCYSLPEFQKVAFGEVVVSSDLPDSIEISLTDDACEDIELAMSPSFVDAMLRLGEALHEREIDWENVRRRELRPTSS